MTVPDPDHLDIGAMAGSLDSLLTESDSPETGWAESDYASLLEHQLAARLSGDLSLFFADALEALAECRSRTFIELLTSRSPSLPALKMVRHFAKKLIARNDKFYPDAVARVLYFASIAAARTHAGIQITKLDAGQIREGYAWALSQPWLNGELRTLFTEAAAG